MLGRTFGQKVGLRYLRAKKSSRFLSLITAISVGGVAVGVYTLIVTLSVMAGFESELTKRLFASDTHIRIEPESGSTLVRDPNVIGKIAQLDTKITGVYPVFQTEIILRAGKKVSGSVLKGIGPDQLRWLKSMVSEWAATELIDPSVDGRLFIGSELAFDIGVIPGDVITTVSPVPTDGPLGAVPRVKKFVVEGVYKSGIPEQELHVVFAEMKHVESFLRKDDVWSQIEVRVDSLKNAPNVAAKLKAENLVAHSLVRPWQEINAHLFSSLKLERTAMFCILIFIVIVASFNITSTLTMMVVEKRRSLSILRAMGATPRHIRSIFQSEGLAIGLVGIAIGGLLAFGTCWFLRKYPLLELPEYFFDRTVPVVLQPLGIMLVCFCALIIVMVAARVPARRAGLLTPIEGIRNQ